MISIPVKTATGYRGYPGKVVKAADFVLHLEELKKKHGRDPWPVIETLLNFWADQNPTRFKSFLYQMEETRASRADKVHGESRGGAFRYTLDIPQDVMYMIRHVYSVEELPMDKQFFHEWGVRFPKTKVAEKS